jgi:RNA polymerase sigma factor (sigma-70 family)
VKSDGAALNNLAERARAGSREALDGLVAGLQGPLYQLALRFLGIPADARDATQEILILIITQLGGFRGESAVTTWAYRIAVRHLARQRQRFRKVTFEQLAQDDLGQGPGRIGSEALAQADERLLEEEVFVGCTQAMLQALDAPQRIAFVLGAILELEASEAAAALDISEQTFRKRLSRARAALDGFVARHCGVADARNRCQCRFQVNHNVERGRLDPARLRFALPTARTSVEALRAFGELQTVRRSLELYRAQPTFAPGADFAEHLRGLIAAAGTLAS